VRSARLEASNAVAFLRVRGVVPLTRRTTDPVSEGMAGGHPRPRTKLTRRSDSRTETQKHLGLLDRKPWSRQFDALRPADTSRHLCVANGTLHYRPPCWAKK
jgi:hypothetical protein